MRQTNTNRQSSVWNLSLVLAAITLALIFVAAKYTRSLVTAKQGSADLTGNWRVQTQKAMAPFDELIST